jgi:DNA-binding response OmpR family regulator
MNKILVIDGDEAIRLLYADVLTEEGYEVITSGDGSQVIELIEQKRPDLILMEAVLGQYDGLDLLQDIRNAFYRMPVILCTAYSHFRYDVRSIAADHYVVKSSDLTELKVRIKMAMEASGQYLIETTVDTRQHLVSPLEEVR